jgi:ABC-2 type transport system ATP-binding protein
MAIEVNGISKTYTGKKAVDNVSFTAEAGKALGLLGRNGAGKTTTIRILMNVIHPECGSVTLDGKPINYDKVRIGYLPEERGLYAKKEIFSQLVYFARLKGMERADAARSVDGWLERVGLAEYRNKKLETLSKGNQQKVQLITALAHDPQIIILDEPFSGLDPVNAMMLEEIVKEQIAQGKIVLFSSHQMNYIEEFCDDIVILNHGSRVLYGNLREIQRSYPRTKLLVRSDRADEIRAAYGAACRDYDRDLLEITLADAGEKQQAMAKLVEQFSPDEIRVFEPSLNDIFIEYTQEEETK